MDQPVVVEIDQLLDSSGLEHWFRAHPEVEVSHETIALVKILIDEARLPFHVIVEELEGDMSHVCAVETIAQFILWKALSYKEGLFSLV